MVTCRAHGWKYDVTTGKTCMCRTLESAVTRKRSRVVRFLFLYRKRRPGKDTDEHIEHELDCVRPYLWWCVVGVPAARAAARSSPEYDFAPRSEARMGTIATMTALVLGLLVNSAKNSYDARAAHSLRCPPRLCCWTECWRIMDLRQENRGIFCVKW